MKYGLDSTGKYQRLLGQLIQYSEWEGRIVVLLTGKTDVNLRKQLEEFVREQNNSWANAFSIEGSRIVVFEK